MGYVLSFWRRRLTAEEIGLAKRGKEIGYGPHLLVSYEMRDGKIIVSDIDLDENPQSRIEYTVDGRRIKLITFGDDSTLPAEVDFRPGWVIGKKVA